MIALGSELLGRLAGAAGLLCALSAGSSPTTISQEPTAEGLAWTASTTSASPSCSASTVDARGYAQAALSEIRISKAILGQANDLAADIAFAAYLGEIDKAVTDFENDCAASAQALWRLAGQLQSARSDLQSKVSTVPGWLAVTGCVEDSATRLVSLPARFYSRAHAEIVFENAPSPADVDMLFELDGMLSA